MTFGASPTTFALEPTVRSWFLAVAVVAATLGPGSLFAAEGTESPPEETEDEETADDPATFEDEEALFDIAEIGESDDDRNDDEREQRQRRDDIPLRKMDREEAREAGFDFGGREEPTTRTSAALLAATGGLFAHGLGHWYVDDPRTALTLAGMEGGSLALMGSGLAVWMLEGDTVAGSAYGTTAFHLGAGLFGMSYLIDVLGALQGARTRLPENTGQERGLSVHAGYQYRTVASDPLRHFFVGRLDYDLGRVFGTARTDQEFQLGLSEYEGEFGVRLFRGKRDMTFAYIELLGGFLEYRGEGRFDRLRGEARAGVSLDFGLVAPHLEQLAVGVEAGWGVASHRLPVGEPDAYQWMDPAPYLPAEIYTDMNLSERLNLRVSYEKRSGDRLQSTSPLAGVGGIRFRYDSSELFDLELEGKFGGGYSLHAGLGLQVWE